MTLDSSTRQRRTYRRIRSSPRFERPANALIVAALLTPVVTTVAWVFAYWVATTMPEAPSGDTTFAWMPVLYVLFAGPIWLLVALQSAWAFAWPSAPHAFRIGALLTLVGCLVGVSLAFGIAPGWTSRAEGFPIGPLSVTAVVLAAVASLLPSAWFVVVLTGERIIRGWILAILALATVAGIAYVAAAMDML